MIEYPFCVCLREIADRDRELIDCVVKRSNVASGLYRVAGLEGRWHFFLRKLLLSMLKM